MAKDIQTARWERAHKARALYEANAYEVVDDGLLVFSETGQGCYLVTAAGCTCPDSTEGFAARLLNGHCKHVEVGQIIARAAQPAPRRLPPLEEGAPPPKPVPNVVALAREAERARREQSFVRPAVYDGPFKAERGARR